jgi:hypothetical protein
MTWWRLPPPGSLHTKGAVSKPGRDRHLILRSLDLILDTPTLSAADRIAILGGTGAELLRMVT